MCTVLSEFHGCCVGVWSIGAKSSGYIPVGGVTFMSWTSSGYGGLFLVVGSCGAAPHSPS